MSPFQLLVRSRKAWISTLAIISVVAMTLLGKLDGEKALDFVKWIVSAWLIAIAVDRMPPTLPPAVVNNYSPRKEDTLPQGPGANI